jgi:microcystin-dependent protein
MEPFIGEIRLVPFNFVPKGWAMCDGQLLSIAENTALFSLLGTNYGGNGKSSFGLPDLRGRVPVGAGQFATGTFYTLGETGGQETVELTTDELPQHAHDVHASSAAGTTENPTAAFPASGGAYAVNRDAEMNSAMIRRAGGGGRHENRQPWLGLHYIIALEGTFPSPS